LSDRHEAFHIHRPPPALRRATASTVVTAPAVYVETTLDSSAIRRERDDHRFGNVDTADVGDRRIRRLRGGRGGGDGF
jgi:hypothetical protein